MKIKFPHVKVELIGKNGNAFAILSAVQAAMRDSDISREEINKYLDKAMEGDYNNLLRVTMETVEVI